MDQDMFKDMVTKEIERFVEEDESNRLDKLDCSPIFQKPLVGFVPGDDSIFVQLKSVIGKYHMTPREAMTKSAAITGKEMADDEPACAISFILPINQDTRDENARADNMPTERWVHTRFFGQEFIDKLERHVVEFLIQQGFLLACAPDLEKKVFNGLYIDKDVGWTSNWSHRHVAFACGLGTFGLSDGLITAAGKAHRIGSVVVNQRVDSPDRPEDIHAYCTFFQTGGCMKCAKRCPANAISENGHDKNKCGEFVFSQIPYIRETFGISSYSCGMCQTGVPCERGIPANKTLLEDGRPNSNLA
jgi:epoxyqueuosine reductase QueG